MPRYAGSPFLDPEEPKWKVKPAKPGRRPPPGPPPLPPHFPSRPGARHRFRRARFGLPVGRALSETFAIWFRSLPVFYALGLVVYAPLLACAAVLYARRDSLEHPSSTISSFALFANGVSFFFLSTLLSGVVTHGVIARLRGDRARVLPALRVGFSRALPILVVGIVAPLATALGFFLLVVPGLFLLTFLYVALPVAVAERPGALGLGALSRSFDLVRGQGWAVFGTLLVVQIAAWFMSAALQMILMILSIELLTPTLVILVQFAMEPLTRSLTATAPAVVYHELRLGKEGVNVEEIASVFS